MIGIWLQSSSINANAGAFLIAEPVILHPAASTGACNEKRVMAPIDKGGGKHVMGL